MVPEERSLRIDNEVQIDSMVLGRQRKTTDDEHDSHKTLKKRQQMTGYRFIRQKGQRLHGGCQFSRDYGVGTESVSITNIPP